MADYGAEQHINVHVPADARGGVWANFAAVAHSPYEFTLDFVRMEYANETDTELPGVLVARVNLSPLLVTQLIDALQENWERYADKALSRNLGEPGNGEESEW
ncbi:MAG: DUF3467 domain-containing protein [Candidatus Nanopelagicales bacterium]